MADERIRFIDYKGKKILLEDFTNISNEDEFLALLEKVEAFIQQQPPKSLLVCVDLNGARFSTRISQASKEATARNTPFIKASALVGPGGLMDIVMQGVSLFARRELIMFKTREEALEWLDGQ